MHHHRIWYFPVMGAKGGGGGVHVSKEKGDIRKGDEKRGKHHHRILSFPVLVSRGGCMFLKKGGISRREH